MTIVTVNYCKFITNYYENLLQITSTLPQITAKCYYKLQQKILQITAHLFLQNSKLLQITSSFITNKAAFSAITNYGKFFNGYTKRRCTKYKLLLTSSDISA